MQATTFVWSITHLLVILLTRVPSSHLAPPAKTSADSCIHSVDQQEGTALLKTRPVSRLVKPAQPGSIFYFDYCKEVHNRQHTGNNEAGVVRVNDCYEGIYPTMCDYNPNRIPSKIQMADCEKCSNGSRRPARCIKFINKEAVRGNWQPIMMNMSLPFNTSTSNVYQLQIQQIAYACFCNTQ